MPRPKLERALDDCLRLLRRGAPPTMPVERRTLVRQRMMAWIRSEQQGRAGRRGWHLGRLLLVPATALAIVAALFFSLQSSQAPNVAEAASVLTVLQGEVQVEAGQGLVAGQNGMLLQAGDKVITSKGARAVITFFDGSTITLDAETAVAIQSISGEKDHIKVTLKQQKGSTWTYVPQELGPSQIEIETPHARVQTTQATFSTTVDSGRRTGIGAQSGALGVHRGGPKTELAGG